MSDYQEMIQFVVDQVDNNVLRYNEWAAVLVIAKAYNINSDIVASDIQLEKNLRDKARKDARKAENRASNEARRLANLARKQNEQTTP